MQIVDRDNLLFELRPENLEDLWVLSQFIVPQDKVFATTQRKVKLGNDKTKQVTKIIAVDLLVTKVSFESDILRVSGEIQNETEFTSVGQAHTLSFSPTDKIKIQKQSLLQFEEKLLSRSIESKQSKNLLVLLDKDELLTSEFGDFSYHVLFHEKGLGSKKYHHTEVNENEEKFKLLEELFKRDYGQIVLAGPGLWKEKLKKYVKDKIGLDTLSFSWHDVRSESVQKVIKAVSESGLLTQNQLSSENEKISLLLRSIDSGSKSAYGFEKTYEQVLSGSCETFLITTKYIDTQKEGGCYAQINELMRTVEQLNGDLVIVNSKNEPGKILDGLGGVAAILRY